MGGEGKEGNSGEGRIPFNPERRRFLRGVLRTTAVIAGAVALSSCGVKTDSAGTDAAEKFLVEKKKSLRDAQCHPVSVSRDYLGAVDSKDPNVQYPRAIREGGIMNVGGANVRITYKGGVFADDDVTFMSWSEESGKQNVGDILPYTFIFTQKEEKTETGEEILHRITLDNLAMPLQGSKSREIPLQKDTMYCVIPIIIAGTSSDIVDNGNTPAQSFEIGSNNLLGTDRGYLSWALLQVSKEQNDDGTWGAQMMGVVKNTSSSGIYLDSDSPDIPNVRVV
jgi:hypothetical protein